MKRKKKLSRSEREKRKEIRIERDTEELIENTAQTFTCTHEIANDFAYQCSDQAINLEADILFTQIAIEIWDQKSAPITVPLVKTLKELLIAREHHYKNLLELETQFKRLVELNEHEHLEPLDPYTDLIRGRLDTIGKP
jgi:hypothetical protein